MPKYILNDKEVSWEEMQKALRESEISIRGENLLVKFVTIVLLIGFIIFLWNYVIPFLQWMRGLF